MSSLVSDGRRLPRKIRLLLFAAAAAALFFLLRRTLAQLAFQVGLGVLLAWAAKPLCMRFERRFPPGVAALLSLLCFAGVLLLFFILFIPPLIAQIGEAVAAVPQLIAVLRKGVDQATSAPWYASISKTLSPSGDFLQRLSEKLLSVIPRAAQLLGKALSRVSRAFLAPVLAFYFLRDREDFCFQLSLCIPLQVRKRALSAIREMRREVAGYYRGQVLVSAATGTLTAISLLILGMPLWLPLGILMGVCDLIPYAGPWLGAIPIVLFSLPLGITTTLWVIAAILLVQQIESMFLSPHFMSVATGLHPAYVLLLLSAGGLLRGLIGMFLALPLFVCLRGAIRALQCSANTEKEPP